MFTVRAGNQQVIMRTSSLRVSSLSEHLDLCNECVAAVAALQLWSLWSLLLRVGLAYHGLLAPLHYITLHWRLCAVRPTTTTTATTSREREEARQRDIHTPVPYAGGSRTISDRGHCVGWKRALADFLPFWMPIIIGRDRLRRQAVDST